MPKSEGGTKKFKIEELFEAANGDFDIQKIHLNGKGVVVISSGENNNGVIGKTDIPARIFSANTLTIDMFGNSYYQYEPYKIVTHARVFSLSPKENMCMSERIGLFMIAKFRFFKQIFAYNNMCSWEKIRRLEIEMPINKFGNIDFAYIEERVRELEQERVRELENYLKVAGLMDYKLTEKESEVLDEFNSGGVLRREVKIGDLFDIHPTKAYKYTNKDLFCENGKNPVLANSSTNNGIGGCSNLPTTESGNMITFSDTTTSDAIFYQPEAFIGYPHVQGLYPKKYKNNWNEQTLLYVMSIFRKCAYGRFDYATKFTRVLALEMTLLLPIEESGNVDFEFMETYISAVKKQTIARLHQFIECEKSAYLGVINPE